LAESLSISLPHALVDEEEDEDETAPPGHLLHTASKPPRTGGGAKRTSTAGGGGDESGYAPFFVEYTDGAANTNRTSCELLDFVYKFENEPFSKFGTVPVTANIFDTSLTRHPSRSPMADTQRYATASASTRACISRVKLAYPDYVGAYANLPQQPLRTFPNALRDATVARMQSSNDTRFRHRIVYDLDALYTVERNDAIIELKNTDAEFVGKESATKEDHLLFESRFESGNLRLAVQTGEREYELHLSPDINQYRTHFQWFYFQVKTKKEYFRHWCPIPHAVPDLLSVNADI
jgi:hypothetical protein